MQKFLTAPHFVVFIPLALEWGAVLLPPGHKNLHLLWHLTDVILRAVQLNLLTAGKKISTCIIPYIGNLSREKTFCFSDLQNYSPSKFSCYTVLTLWDWVVYWQRWTGFLSSRRYHSTAQLQWGGEGCGHHTYSSQWWAYRQRDDLPRNDRLQIS